MENLIEIRSGRFINIIQKAHESDSTLFFFHGVGGRAAQWRYQIEHFAPHANIVAMEYLGHGQSLKPLSPSKSSLYEFEAMSADALAVFQRYKTKHNVVIGHSYGGAIATQVAFNNPEIAKIILIAPLPYQLKIPLRRLLLRLPDACLQLLRRVFIKHIYKRFFNAKTQAELLQTELQNNMLNPIYVIKNMVLGIANMPAIDLAQIQQPVLLILSSKDQIIHFKKIKTFYEKLPNLQLEVIQDANHLMMLEQPERMNHLIAQFLNEK